MAGRLVLKFITNFKNWRNILGSINLFHPS